MTLDHPTLPVLKAAFPDVKFLAAEFRGQTTVVVPKERLKDVCRHLRDDPRCQFVSIIDVTANDWPAREQRFDVVYHLLSPAKNMRVRVKVPTDEETPVPSIIGVYPGADWFERETYDLYGIPFTGHPDMRRLLTDYGFIGHPFRKDFPTSGHVEMRYDAEQKRVIYQPVTIEPREITPRIIREENYGGGLH